MDPVILKGPFQHEIFYDSMKYRNLGGMHYLRKTHRLKGFVYTLLSVLVSVDWEK